MEAVIADQKQVNTDLPAEHAAVGVEEDEGSRGEEEERWGVHRRMLNRLGIIELILWLVCLVLSSLTMVYANEDEDEDHKYNVTNIAVGVWSSFALLFSGIAGLCVKERAKGKIYRRNSMCARMCIIAMSFLVALSSLAFLMDKGSQKFTNIHAALIGVGVVGLVLSFIHDTYCSHCMGAPYFEIKFAMAYMRKQNSEEMRQEEEERRQYMEHKMEKRRMKEEARLEKARQKRLAKEAKQNSEKSKETTRETTV